MKYLKVITKTTVTPKRNANIEATISEALSS
jgi:hypothetical protein